jgi:hypothetical protein
MDQTWKNLKPDDGFFATLHQVGEVKAWLVLAVSLDGKIQQCRQVANVDWPKAADIGALKRKLIVLEAVAEYLNAGGDPAELTDLVGGITSTLDTTGWNYFDTGINEHGNRVHEFASQDGNRYVRWVRNEFIDVDLTLEQVQNDDTEFSRPPAVAEHFDHNGSETPGENHRQLDGISRTETRG